LYTSIIFSATPITSCRKGTGITAAADCNSVRTWLEPCVRNETDNASLKWTIHRKKKNVAGYERVYHVIYALMSCGIYGKRFRAEL
jgi:hypothetical protein